MEIFTEDVGFVDEAIGPKLALPTHVQGRANYEKHLWLLRFHARIFFSKTEVTPLAFLSAWWSSSHLLLQL